MIFLSMRMVDVDVYRGVSSFIPMIKEKMNTMMKTVAAVILLLLRICR